MCSWPKLTVFTFFRFVHRFTCLENCIYPPSILWSALSFSWCLLFFSCNQTHRFISVALRHHLNQFPSTLPSWRATVRIGILQLGTHLCANAHTFSFIHPHSHQSTRTDRHIKTHTHRCTHTHNHTGDSPHHCSLMSYLLHLCNIHLSLLTGPGNSIYPSYLYPHSVSPHSVSLNTRPPPSQLGLFLNLGGRSEDGTQLVAI